MRLPRAMFAVATIVAAITTTSQSRSQTLEEQAAATKATELAESLHAQGKDAEALPHYELAYKNWQTPMTAWRLAQAYERAGRWIEAVQMYRKTVELEPTAKSQTAKDAVAQAKTRILDLDAKIPTIIVKASGATSDAEVRVGSRVVALGVETQVDPGSVTVTLTAPGFSDVTKTVTIASGERAKLVKLTLPSAKPEPPKTEPKESPKTSDKPAPSATPVPTRDPSENPATDGIEGGGVPTWGWIAFGVGSAALVTGSITGIIVMSKSGELADTCPQDTCVGSARDDLRSARGLATVSTVAFAVGVVGVGLGVTAWATAPKSRADAALRLNVGLGSVGLSGSF